MAEFFHKLYVRNPDGKISSEEKDQLLNEVFVNGLKLGAEKIPGEFEKTPDELKMISVANPYIDEHLVRKFGGKEFHFPEENVHIIDIDSTGQDTSKPFVAGGSGDDVVSITAMRSDSQMHKFALIVHEMIHAKSYHAVEAGYEGLNWNYRSGVTLKSEKRGQGYFRIFDEALTEGSSVLALRDALDTNPELFKEDVELAKKYGFDPKEILKQWITYIKEGESDGKKVILSRNGSYDKEKLLYSMFREKFGRKIAERENIDIQEAFDRVKELFYRAKFAGELDKLGLAIDKAFGKSTFTKLAKVSDGLDLDNDSEHSQKDIECERMQKLIESL